MFACASMAFFASHVMLRSNRWKYEITQENMTPDILAGKRRENNFVTESLPPHGVVSTLTWRFDVIFPLKCDHLRLRSTCAATPPFIEEAGSLSLVVWRKIYIVLIFYFMMTSHRHLQARCLDVLRHWVTLWITSAPCCDMGRVESEISNAQSDLSFRSEQMEAGHICCWKRCGLYSRLHTTPKANPSTVYFDLSHAIFRFKGHHFFLIPQQMPSMHVLRMCTGWLADY